MTKPRLFLAGVVVVAVLLTLSWFHVLPGGWRMRGWIKPHAERQAEAPRRMVIPIDMRWRLGYHGVYTTRGFPRNGFGHFGFGGSGAWADARQLYLFP